MSRVFVVPKKFIAGGVGAITMVMIGSFGIPFLGIFAGLALPQFIAVCFALMVGAALVGMFMGVLVHKLDKTPPPTDNSEIKRLYILYRENISPPESKFALYKARLLKALLSPTRKEAMPLGSFGLLGVAAGVSLGFALGFILMSLIHPVWYLLPVSISGCAWAGLAVAILMNHYLPVGGADVKSFRNEDEVIAHFMQAEHSEFYTQRLAVDAAVAARSPADAAAEGGRAALSNDLLEGVGDDTDTDTECEEATPPEDDPSNVARQNLSSDTGDRSASTSCGI